MTALAALWRLDGANPAQDVERMQAGMAAYATGSLSLWHGGATAMARRIMPFLPEDIHDRGVRVGGDGAFVLAADVRIDNRADLARDLGISPATARAMSDADVLLAGWERWGPAVVRRLRGVFAFVVWGVREQALYLARDVGGQRPLFWTRGRGFIAASSMPSGLFALLGAAPQADPVRVVEFLMPSWGRGPRSWFEGISRVEKGTLLRLDAGGETSERFWRPEEIRTYRAADPRDYAQGLREHLLRAVAAQMRSATPVASQLSSGLDSSAVTAAAARLLLEQGGMLDAFTHVPNPRYQVIAPAGRSGDEGPLAALTARLYPNIRHHRQPMPNMPLLSLHDELHAAFQAPTGNTVNGLWLDQMFRTARSAGIGVMLQAAAGNFTLSYAGDEAAAELFGQARIGAGLRHIRALHRSEGQNLRALFRRALVGHAPVEVQKVLRRLAGRPAADPRILSALQQARWEDPLVQAILAGDRADIPGDPSTDGRRLRTALLQRGDQGSYIKGFQALYGIDLRDPTRDQDLVSFSLSLPTEMFSHGGRRKSLYRQAFGAWLPAEVLDNKARGAQGANWQALVQRDKALLSQALKDGAGRLDAVIDYAALEQDIADIGRLEYVAFDGAARIYHRLLRGLTLIRFIART